MNKTELLNRCAQNADERVLFARVLDKLEAVQRRGVPAHTQFLSPEEQASVTLLLAAWGHPRYFFWGGYEQAERQICVFLPDWQEEDDFCTAPECPIAALEAGFPQGAQLSHRDILGSLMGLGISREMLGDILIEETQGQLLLLRRGLPILLSQWESAGRWRLKLHEIPLSALHIQPPKTKIIRDTAASLRLDSVLASGFSMSRAKAVQYIRSGRAALNHRVCIKPDQTILQGDILTCRGLGKCVVKEVLGTSKKGRIMIELERYIQENLYGKEENRPDK